MTQNNKTFNELSNVYVDEFDFLFKVKSSSTNETVEYNQAKTIRPHEYVSNLGTKEVSDVLYDHTPMDCDEEIDHLADDESCFCRK